MTSPLSRGERPGDRIEAAGTADEDPYSSHVSRAVSVLPPAERAVVRRSWALTRAGLLAARRGELATARQALAESEQTELRFRPGSPGRAFCRSARAAAAAYLLYRGGAFDGAAAPLTEANAADLELLARGVAVIHVHRTQLVHNLVRIEVRRRQVQVARVLAGRLLRHLHGQEVALPPEGPWAPSLVDACPPELVAAMRLQVRAEYEGLTEPGLPP